MDRQARRRCERWGLVAVLAASAAALLVGLILLQSPQGSGLAAAFGGAGEVAFGTAEAPIRRLTGGLAGLWLTACLAHSLLL